MRREAFVVSYGDGFFLLEVALAWFCRPVKGGIAGVR
jgi:hypothetical protein